MNSVFFYDLFSDLFNDKCDDFEIRYECCKSKTRRNRRDIPLTESGFDNSFNHMRSLVVDYAKSIDDLKYESRLQFGNGTEPLESLVWEATQSILIDLVKSRNMSRSISSIPINKEEISSTTNSNNNYKYTLYCLLFLLIIPVIIVIDRRKLCYSTMGRWRLMKQTIHGGKAVQRIREELKNVFIDANTLRQTGITKFKTLKSVDEKDMKKMFRLKNNFEYQTFI